MGIDWGGILGNTADNIISQALPGGDSSDNTPENSLPTAATTAAGTAPAGQSQTGTSTPVDPTKLYFLVGGGLLVLVVLIVALKR